MEQATTPNGWRRYSKTDYPYSHSPDICYT